MKDIAYYRKSALAFKTSHFIKRQWGRLMFLMGVLNQKFWVGFAAVHHGLLHMIHGLKTLGGDVKWAVPTRSNKSAKRFRMTSYKQKKRLRQVRTDVIKFLPFSLFLLIPGGELFLPAWVLVFPNSVPSQFVSEADRKKKFQELKERQEAACERLVHAIPIYLDNLLKDHDVSEKDK